MGILVVVDKDSTSHSFLSLLKGGETTLQMELFRIGGPISKFCAYVQAVGSPVDRVYWSRSTSDRNEDLVFLQNIYILMAAVLYTIPWWPLSE